MDCPRDDMGYGSGEALTRVSWYLRDSSQAQPQWRISCHYNNSNSINGGRGKKMKEKEMNVNHVGGSRDCGCQ